MKNKILPLFLFFLLLIGLAAVAAMGYHWHAVDSPPLQPIRFSHPIHIEKVGLGCLDCHKGASVSAKAGIPGAAVCATCHDTVAVERPEVQKLLSYKNKEESIPWVKVHDLGWHARFNHKRHIQAKIECDTCHGQLKAMELVRQARSLSMGWCVTCHRNNGAATDCLTCHK